MKWSAGCGCCGGDPTGCIVEELIAEGTKTPSSTITEAFVEAPSSSGSYVITLAVSKKYRIDEILATTTAAAGSMTSDFTAITWTVASLTSYLNTKRAAVPAGPDQATIQAIIDDAKAQVALAPISTIQTAKTTRTTAMNSLNSDVEDIEAYIGSKSVDEGDYDTAVTLGATMTTAVSDALAEWLSIRTDGIDLLASNPNTIATANAVLALATDIHTKSDNLNDTLFPDLATATSALDTHIGYDIFSYPLGTWNTSESDFTGFTATDGQATVTATKLVDNSTDFTVEINHNAWQQTFNRTTSEVTITFFYEVTAFTPDDCEGTSNQTIQVKQGVHVLPTGLTAFEVYSTHTFDSGFEPTPSETLVVETPSATDPWRMQSNREVSGVDDAECMLIDDVHPCPQTCRRWRCYAWTKIWTTYPDSWLRTTTQTHPSLPTDLTTDETTTGMAAYIGSQLQYLVDSVDGPVTDSGEINEAINGPMDEHWYWNKWSTVDWSSWQVGFAERDRTLNVETHTYGTDQFGDPADITSDADTDVRCEAGLLPGNGTNFLVSCDEDITLTYVPDWTLESGIFPPPLLLCRDDDPENETYVAGDGTFDKYPASRTIATSLAAATTALTYSTCDTAIYECDGEVTAAFEQDAPP